MVGKWDDAPRKLTRLAPEKMILKKTKRERRGGKSSKNIMTNSRVVSCYSEFFGAATVPSKKKKKKLLGFSSPVLNQQLTFDQKKQKFGSPRTCQRHFFVITPNSLKPYATWKVDFASRAWQGSFQDICRVPPSLWKPRKFSHVPWSWSSVSGCGCGCRCRCCCCCCCCRCFLNPTFLPIQPTSPPSKKKIRSIRSSSLPGDQEEPGQGPSTI